MSQLTVLSELNGCSVEKIAELVVDIPLDDEISQKKVICASKGKKYTYHRDCDSDRIKFYKGFARRLRKKMNQRKLDAAGLSKLANTSKSAITSYLNAERLPDILTLYKIAKSLNVSTDELLGIDKVRREINE